MKKTIVLLITIMVVLSVLLIGCGANPNDETSASSETSVSSEISNAGASAEETNRETQETEQSEDEDVSQVLVVYFSNTGTTESVAQMIQSETGGILYQIQAEEPYAEDDLKYYTGGRADQEQADESCRPGIANLPESLDAYDVIFLGYPIWHGQAPKIIYTFLESYDLSGKAIVPFCTSHSSDIGSSDDNLHASAPSADWKDGKRFSSESTQSDIKAWITSLSLTQQKQNTATDFHLSEGVNGMASTVTLNSGYEMPVIGIGTYSLHDDTCKEAIKTALANGVRLIDTAYMYGNEKEVGEAIRESGIPREEIFVITKIYPGEQFANPKQAIEDALEKLDIEYIDDCVILGLS